MTNIGDQLREQTVDTVLGRIRLQVGGSGSPIVFWPSLLMTGDMWYGVADGLVARVERPDERSENTQLQPNQLDGARFELLGTVLGAHQRDRQMPEDQEDRD